MPKQKTHKGLQKRVKVTATGKIKHKKPGAGHLMGTKSGRRCRHLAKPAIMLEVYARKALIKLCEKRKG